MRTLAWTRCFDTTHTLRFRDAIRAYLIGDALGNVMPLGIVVSEPAKAALVRDRVPLTAAISALAVENLFYMLSVALFIFAGTAAMLATFNSRSNANRGLATLASSSSCSASPSSRSAEGRPVSRAGVGRRALWGGAWWRARARVGP